MHGVEEKYYEDIDELMIGSVTNDLGLNISRDDIQGSHQLGPKISKRNTKSTKIFVRPIIFRFVSYRKRKEVFKAKKLLKDKIVSLSENLTKSRYELYKAAMAKHDRGNASTTHGRFLLKLEMNILILIPMTTYK